MPGGFDIEWAKSLRPSCREQGFHYVLTCHHTDKDEGFVCASYLADQMEHGISNFRVRMALLCCKIEPHECLDNDLMSYEEMIEQMEV